MALCVLISNLQNPVRTRLESRSVRTARVAGVPQLRAVVERRAVDGRTHDPFLGASPAAATDGPQRFLGTRRGRGPRRSGVHPSGLRRGCPPIIIKIKIKTRAADVFADGRCWIRLLSFSARAARPVRQPSETGRSSFHELWIYDFNSPARRAVLNFGTPRRGRNGRDVVLSR